MLLLEQAELNRYEVVAHKLSNDDTVKLDNAKEEMKNWRLGVADCSSYKLDKITKMIEQLNPKYVFIDPLQEIDANTKTALDALKKCVLKTNSTIFVTSLINDTFEDNADKLPSWKDFKDAESVISYSDEVLLMYRPDIHYSEYDMPEGHKTGTIEIISTKALSTKIRLDFDNRICKILEPREYDFY